LKRGKVIDVGEIVMKLDLLDMISKAGVCGQLEITKTIGKFMISVEFVLE
jgi:hypothetical protein